MLTSVREANTSVGRTEDVPSYRASSKMARASDLKLCTVKRVAEARLPTEFADFRIIDYRSLNSTEEFVVLVRGEVRDARPSLVRIHSQCMTGDVFGSIKCD